MSGGRGYTASMTPLKGDPDLVRKEAESLREAAQAMRDARDSIAHVTSFASYHSGAVTALNDNAEGVGKQIKKAATRYRGTGDALTSYAGRLEQAQQDADAAIRDYEATDVASASSRHDTLQLSLARGHAMTDEERAQAQTDLSQASDDLESQRAAANSARQRWEDARHDAEQAADDARHAIEDAIDDSDLDDSWWDKISEFVSNLDWKKILDVLKSIADWVATIATVLAVVCLVLSPFLPFLAPLAAILFTVSRVAGLISAAIGVIQFLRGDIDLSDMIVGALFAVGGGLLKAGKAAKFFKVLGKSGGGKATKKLAKQVRKDAKKAVREKLKDPYPWKQARKDRAKLDAGTKKKQKAVLKDQRAVLRDQGYDNLADAHRRGATKADLMKAALKDQAPDFKDPSTYADLAEENVKGAVNYAQTGEGSFSLDIVQVDLKDGGVDSVSASYGPAEVSTNGSNVEVGLTAGSDDVSVKAGIDFSGDGPQPTHEATFFELKHSSPEPVGR